MQYNYITSYNKTWTTQIGKPNRNSAICIGRKLGRIVILIKGQNKFPEWELVTSGVEGRTKDESFFDWSKMNELMSWSHATNVNSDTFQMAGKTIKN